MQSLKLDAIQTELAPEAAGRGAEKVATQAHHDASRRLAGVARLESAHDMPERDVTSPLATVPVDNPATNPTVTSTNPAAMPGTQTTPSLANPVAAGGGGGGSWCVASPSASKAALQVALDYACGQGGVDCSAIQSGGSCFNPDTVRDHASFAFNNYYQKNPVQTSCDFAGTAILTSTDPSSSSCKYPSTSTGASVLNTSTPTTPTFGGYDNSPPGLGNSPPLYGSMSPPGYSDNIGAAAAMASSKKTLLSLACVVATVSLNLYK
uniref:X8 domain-containing protein n=1 Tax=Oryza punctata TaxID=4537 RepID=A0A0E0L676_ORYPU